MGGGKPRKEDVGGDLSRIYFGMPMIGRWAGVDQLAEKYPNISPYAYVANNPLKYIDPDGRTIVPVHGTWSDEGTWKNLDGITKASDKLFGGNNLGKSFAWSGGNYSSMRTKAASELIVHVRSQMKNEDFDGKITLVGHSHGGNVSIEALNMMVEMEEFNDVEFNLLTINTPVRDDYQLSENATERVDHVNVYDVYDPVQSHGGNARVRKPNEQTNKKGTGEFGPSGRVFHNARNIPVSHPQNELGDFHNSHNRVNDWINNKQYEW